MKEYLRKVWNVVLFFGIWIGIPYYFVHTYNEPNFFIGIMFMWLPAVLISMYLNDK